MRIAALLLVLLAGAASAQDDGKPKGKNCDLTKAPRQAGEVMLHGVDARIYPRTRDLGRGYNGCQVWWVGEYPADFHLYALVEVVNGDHVRFWSPIVKGPETACRFRNGKVVVGDPEKCPKHYYLFPKSMRAGCLAKLKTAPSYEVARALLDGECKHV